MNYPPIPLSRKVRVRHLDILATILRPESREEFLLVLQFGEELLEAGFDFTPEMVATEWLPDFPTSAGKRILQRLEDLNLVTLAEGSRGETFLPQADMKYILSPQGQVALLTKRIFVPERHEIRVRYIEDELFPRAVVGIGIIEKSLREVILEDQEDRAQSLKHERGEIIELPEVLRRIQKREIVILEGEESYVGSLIFDEIEEKAISWPIEQQGRINLVFERWGESTYTLQIGEKIHHLSPPKVPYEDLFLSLLQQENHSWSAEQEAVKCQYVNLTTEEKRTFKRDFVIRTPQFEGLGIFEQTVVRDVSITPRTREDAELWANFLLKDAIRDYITEDEYVRIADAIRAKFPFWEHLRIQSIQECIREERETFLREGLFSPLYWFLQTPKDLEI